VGATAGGLELVVVGTNVVRGHRESGESQRILANRSGAANGCCRRN